MKKVAVIFGGVSVEHEVSVITGMQVMENLDKNKYSAVAVYITKEGKFLSGEALKDFRNFKNQNFSEAVEVYFKPERGDHNLYTIEKEKGGLFKKSGESEKVYEKIDIVFPALHGTYGEDGSLQGLFELMDIPYVGCGVAASALGMDKSLMKQVFKASGIPITDYLILNASEIADIKKVSKKVETLGYPVFVKPASLGSSIGISRVASEKELEEALKLAANFDRKIVVEAAVVNPREINAAVLGYADNLRVSALEEPVEFKEMLKFEDKYVGGKNQKAGMKNSKKNLPAEVGNLKEEIEELAMRSFSALGCAGVSRIDFLLDGDKVYVNEINTLPGSIAFYLFEVLGLKMNELIDELLDIALKVHEEKSKRSFKFDVDLFNLTSFGVKL